MGTTIKRSEYSTRRRFLRLTEAARDERVDRELRPLIRIGLILIVLPIVAANVGLYFSQGIPTAPVGLRVAVLLAPLVLTQLLIRRLGRCVARLAYARAYRRFAAESS